MFHGLAIRCALMAVAFLMFAGIASAQYIDGGYYPDVDFYIDPCGGTMDPDTCFWSDFWAYAGGGYSACEALGASGQMCVIAAQDLTSNVRSCAYVTRSASCNCDSRTLTVSGICTYIK